MEIIMDKRDILTNVFRGILAGALLLIPLTTSATKFISVKVIDKDYLMVHFRDGEVRYRDDATGPSAYLGHSFAEGDDTLLVFGARLDVSLAKDASLWTVSSPDDRQFASQHPVAVWRKSKPMNTNHNLDSELDHWLFLQMPKSMRQGCTYTVTIPQDIGSDKTTASLRFDIWNTQSEADHVSKMALRPSRRSANDSRWQTSENLDLVLMAHYIATDASRKEQLLNAMCADASWCLGRNPGNIVEMTGLGQRHITDVYSTGRNDGAPGTHPGQTPFNGTETWSPGNGGDARILLQRCYPEWKNWPKQESYFNQRYMWVNAEFTPRETMRGKMALYAYLYGINK